MVLQVIQAFMVALLHLRLFLIQYHQHSLLLGESVEVVLVVVLLPL